MRKKYEEIWRWKPLKLTILEILEERGGSISDLALLEELRKRGEDVSRSELNRILMRMEIDGLIHVESVSFKEKIVEKVSEKMRYLSVGED